MKTPFKNSTWIAADLAGGWKTGTAAPYFRKRFTLKQAPSSAHLAISALGIFDAEINGTRVSEDVFAPGWTNYAVRVPYRVYDVTALLREGENVLGAILGDGWYCGHVAWAGRCLYGDRPSLRSSLEMIYADGHTEIIGTDPSWRTSAGAIIQSDLLMGEDYDARREPAGWSEPGFDDAGWRAAIATEPEPEPELSEAIGPPVRRIEELEAVWLSRHPAQYTAAGVHRASIYDLRQNFSGWIRIHVTAPRGTLLRFRFAEILDEQGRLYVQNLRGAQAADSYVCRGGGQEIWEPRFTFHGFRYVEIVAPVSLPEENVEITGIVAHSDMARTGHFACSHPLLNQLQHNIVWGQKSNFLEVPTDCPQRDERLGWTGDAHVFIRTACFNMDVRAFFHKWMRDARDTQSPSGAIPRIIPCPLPRPDSEDGGPAWSDANIICPWTVYLHYGDRKILEDHYGSMKRYLAWLQDNVCKDGIRSHPDAVSWGGFGDWLALDGGGTMGLTPHDLIGTAFYACDLEIMTRVAALLEHDDDAAAYRQRHSETVRAFQRRFVTADGLLVSGTQTSYTLALHFGLLPEDLRPAAAAELVRDIQKRDYHLATGFVGTPYLLDALENAGRLDIAYRLLEQETFPSWLFPVKNGATTIWERWDGWTPEKGFQSPDMNSFNHYAYGAVGAWMYRSVAGLELDAEAPGYRHIVFRPRPGGSITWAEASLETTHGRTAIRWEKDGGDLRLRLTVPDGCRATLDAPRGFDIATRSLPAGEHELTLRALYIKQQSDGCAR